MVDAIKSLISNHKSQIVPEVHDTICRSVANRVAQLQDFARANDLVIFVGGAKSSNARVLYNHCKEANGNTFFVSNADDVENFKFEIINHKSTNPDLKIGICGATSTPLWLMKQVRDKLTNLQPITSDH